jgi:hypothetical protein
MVRKSTVASSSLCCSKVSWRILSSPFGSPFARSFLVPTEKRVGAIAYSRPSPMLLRSRCTFPIKVHKECCTSLQIFTSTCLLQRMTSAMLFSAIKSPLEQLAFAPSQVPPGSSFSSLLRRGDAGRTWRQKNKIVAVDVMAMASQRAHKRWTKRKATYGRCSWNTYCHSKAATNRPSEPIMKGQSLGFIKRRGPIHKYG